MHDRSARYTRRHARQARTVIRKREAVRRRDRAGRVQVRATCAWRVAAIGSRRTYPTARRRNGVPAVPRARLFRQWCGAPIMKRLTPLTSMPTATMCGRTSPGFGLWQSGRRRLPVRTQAGKLGDARRQLVALDYSNSVREFLIVARSPKSTAPPDYDGRLARTITLKDGRSAFDHVEGCGRSIRRRVRHRHQMGHARNRDQTLMKPRRPANAPTSPKRPT